MGLKLYHSVLHTSPTTVSHFIPFVLLLLLLHVVLFIQTYSAGSISLGQSCISTSYIFSVTFASELKPPTQEVFEMAQVSEMEHVEQAVRSRFKSAWVICESKSGNKEIYKAAATELGKELVSRGVDIVHDGGESTGLMDCVVKAMQDGGGNVREIIPRRVLGAEGEFVTYMHQRKAEMARHADCFIALPGGYRTLEELLEAVSWSQLGIHDKPVGLLNVNGYYNSFLSFIDNSVDESFIKPSHSHIIVWATNAKELLDKLEDYVPVPDRPLNRESWEV